MILKIWNFTKKIFPNTLHSLVKRIYTFIFCLIFSHGYFKKFNYLDIIFFIKVNPKNGVVDNVILMEGVLDGSHLQIIKNTLNPTDYFIDIGANIGQYSLFASYCAPQGKVISFEPVKDIFDQFAESIAKNNIKNITLYNKASGSTNQISSIYKTQGDAGGSSILDNNDIAKKTIEQIEIVTLDNFLSDIKKVDFIKIDTEGFEYETLIGAKNIINKFKPTLLIEYSPHIYDKHNKETGLLILNFLFDNSYTIEDTEDNRIIESPEDEILSNKGMTNLFCYIK